MQTTIATPQTIGQRLKEAIGILPDNDVAIGKRARVPIANLYRYKAGVIPRPALGLVRLALVAGLTPNELFLEEDFESLERFSPENREIINKSINLLALLSESVVEAPELLHATLEGMVKRLRSVPPATSISVPAPGEKLYQAPPKHLEHLRVGEAPAQYNSRKAIVRKGDTGKNKKLID